MKYLRTLSAYVRGIRWPMFVLSFMMTVSMLIGVITMGTIRYLYRHYDIVSGTTGDSDRIYYYMPTTLSASNTRTLELLEALEEKPAVQHVYTIYSVSPVSYRGEKRDIGVGIQLVDPGLLELFPGLGLNLRNTDDVMVGVNAFRDVAVGESITLLFYHPSREVEFTVAGQMFYPYSSMAFSGGSNRPCADDLFYSHEILQMLATPENLQRFEEYTNLHIGENFLLEFRADATAEEIEQVRLFLAGTGNAMSLRSILDRSEENLQMQMRNTLPLPVMMLLISSFAYFSTMIMAFKQKERDLAIFHLCGASRWQCITAVIGAFCRVCVIPAVIVTALVAMLPQMDWLWTFTMGQYVIDGWCYGVIGGFFAVSLLMVSGAVWMQMGGHTPLSVLRGVEQ